VANLTPQQIRGTQFEIWFELLLKDLGMNVRRNVIVHRSRYQYRQADLIYRDNNHPLVLVELKYSKDGQIRYKLRRKKKKSGQLVKTIDTVLSELEERRRFIKADQAFLVTNQEYDGNCFKNLPDYPLIKLCDYSHLERLEKNRLQNKSLIYSPQQINDQILKIDLNKHELKPLRCYL